jgi:hypothetical protein
MISKELLSTVLSINVISIERIVNNGGSTYLHYIQFGFKQIEKKKINIYELANKCKIWAFSKWYDILSCIDHEFDSNENSVYTGYAYLVNIKNKDEIINPYKGIEFEGKTEPEAVINACQVVLDRVLNNTVIA